MPTKNYYDFNRMMKKNYREISSIRHKSNVISTKGQLYALIFVLNDAYFNLEQ